MYGLLMVAKSQEAELKVAELKMLRLSLGVTRMGKIRNDKANMSWTCAEKVD